jgi:hypothetical protein
VTGPRLRPGARPTGTLPVKTHLVRTMTELDPGSRAQAVVLAYGTGLVTPGG